MIHKNFDQIPIEEILLKQTTLKDQDAHFVEIRFRKGDLLIQTPRLYVPFDYSSNFGVISVSFRDQDIYQNIKSLKWALGRIDDHLKVIVKAARKLDLRSCRFKKSIRQKGSYPPTLPLKIMPDSRIFDKDKRLIPPSNVTRGCLAISVIKLRGVWIQQKAYGCSWQILQAKIIPPLNTSDFCIIEEDEASTSIYHDHLASNVGPSITHRLQRELVPHESAQRLSNSSHLPVALPPPPPPPPPPPNDFFKTPNVAVSVRDLCLTRKAKNAGREFKPPKQYQETKYRPPSLDEIQSRLNRLRSTKEIPKIEPLREETIADKIINEMREKLREKNMQYCDEK